MKLIQAKQTWHSRGRLVRCVIALLGMLGIGTPSPAQDPFEEPVVQMGSAGPLEDFIDFDSMVAPPPTPEPIRQGLFSRVSWTEGLAQLPGVQKLAQLNQPLVDELLMVQDPTASEVWVADAPQDGGPFGNGGLLGMRGAMQVAGAGTTRVLPNGLIYRPYLAGPKESRLSSQAFKNESGNWLFDNTLGGHVGLIRWGTHNVATPQGVQIDLEASAQLRLDIDDDLILRSADYRAGIPITFGYGPHRTKLAYYHLSSHLGDEYLLATGATRLNYARDALVFGHALYLSPALRLYGEAGWSFYRDVSGPWEFQMGVDYAPSCGTGPGGSPFFGVNGLLRQELNYGGTLTAQAGWAWRSHESGRLLRIGLHYLNGASPQFSFLGVEEQHLGLGIWLDN